MLAVISLTALALAYIIMTIIESMKEVNNED